MFSFLLLIFLNLLVVGAYVQKVRKTNAAVNILEEIEEGYDFGDKLALQEATGSAGTMTAEVQLSDGRAANLKHFFRKYNSPLYDHADFIVKTADKYQMDYRLLPAIAMQESGLCRVIPHDSHNCWGWGIYGTTVTRFDSYEEAIDTVSRGIRKNYLDKGLTTATQIMQKYTPSSPDGHWAKAVNSFMKILE